MEQTLYFNNGPLRHHRYGFMYDEQIFKGADAISAAKEAGWHEDLETACGLKSEPASEKPAKAGAQK